MLRADVTPSFTQNHRDVTDVPQTQACAIHPEGFAALGARQAGHPDETRAIFERVALSEELVEFLTLEAYDYLD